MGSLTTSLTLLALAPGQASCGGGRACDSGLPVVGTSTSQLQTVLHIVFAVAAALAVLMIVIAGFRLVTAQGDPKEVSKAKSTIVYALIGLLVAVTAQAIVALTLGRL